MVALPTYLPCHIITVIIFILISSRFMIIWFKLSHEIYLFFQLLGKRGVCLFKCFKPKPPRTLTLCTVTPGRRFCFLLNLELWWSIIYFSFTEQVSRLPTRTTVCLFLFLFYFFKWIWLLLKQRPHFCPRHSGENHVTVKPDADFLLSSWGWFCRERSHVLSKWKHAHYGRALSCKLEEEELLLAQLWKKLGPGRRCVSVVGTALWAACSCFVPVRSFGLLCPTFTEVSVQPFKCLWDAKVNAFLCGVSDSFGEIVAQTSVSFAVCHTVWTKTSPECRVEDRYTKILCPCSTTQHNTTRVQSQNAILSCLLDNNNNISFHLFGVTDSPAGFWDT